VSRLDQRVAESGLELVRPLGYGAAERWEAVRLLDDGGRQLVAIRPLLPDPGLPDELRGRIVDAARRLAALDHPNLVRVEAIEDGGGEPFLVEELLRGRDLRRLARGAPVPPRSIALSVAAQALRALEHAHARGLVHGDVSAANIVVCDDGAVKLLDLGLAPALEYARTTVASPRRRRQAAAPAASPPSSAQADVDQLVATLQAFAGREATPPPAPLTTPPPAVPPSPSTAALRAVEEALAGPPEQDLRSWLAELAGEAATENARPERPARGSEVTTEGLPPREHAGETLDPGTIVDRYTILSRVGEGGMGTVYAAYDPQLDRKVAIKLLRISAERIVDRQRLLREAQAMARITHPNVVPVHDAGIAGDRVFVAMEFIAGVDLSRWLTRTRRPWREVLRVFREAGRGLAAAHEVGLVHRDFKPENVLCGDDGRILVTDFGLARRATDEEPDTIAPAVKSPNLLSTELTHGGMIVGTPAYMAPEQHRGARPDVRTDVFNFAASLYRALYGELPYDPRVLATWTGEDPAPTAREPPRDSEVPRSIARILARALAPRPEARFATLEALLHALDHSPAVVLRRRVPWAATLLLALALLLGARLLGRDRGRLCRGAAAPLAGAWNAEVKGRARQAFLASGRSYAPETWRRVEAVLDGYAREWATMRTEACEATHVRGEQSDDVLSERILCLDRGLAQLGALSSILETADAAVVDNAVQAASRLPWLGACADMVALRANAQLPTDPNTRARIQRLIEREAGVTALKDAVRTRQALSANEPLLHEARALGYPPLEARLLLMQGDLETALGLFAQAAAHLRDAVTASIAAHDLRSQALAFIKLNYLTQFNHEEAEGRWFDENARAALSRNPDDEVESERLRVQATQVMQEDVPQAIELIQRALALRERGNPHTRAIEVASLLGNLALAYLNADDFAAAERALERAQTVLEPAVGSQSPALAFTLRLLAIARFGQGRSADGLAIARRAYELEHDSLNPFDKTTAFYAVAVGFLEQGQPREALPYLEQIPFKCLQLTLRARARRLLGETPAALTGGREAVQACQKENGTRRTAESAPAWIELGLSALGAGRRAEGVSALKEAVSLGERGARGYPELPRAERLLADLLFEEPDSREQAQKLCQRAQREFTGQGDAARAAEAARWLSEHRRGRVDER
jgi:serine/threonine protein kinase/tetratricopeptide (TPR) repeat protein